MGLALVYFMPAIFEGRELFQQDVAGASGTASDVRALTEATGEVSYWTNSLFGGMPMYQISTTAGCSSPSWRAVTSSCVPCVWGALPPSSGR